MIHDVLGRFCVLRVFLFSFFNVYTRKAFSLSYWSWAALLSPAQVGGGVGGRRLSPGVPTFPRRTQTTVTKVTSPHFCDAAGSDASPVSSFS